MRTWRWSLSERRPIRVAGIELAEPGRGGPRPHKSHPAFAHGRYHASRRSSVRFGLLARVLRISRGSGCGHDCAGDKVIIEWPSARMCTPGRASSLLSTYWRCAGVGTSFQGRGQGQDGLFEKR